MHKITIWMY